MIFPAYPRIVFFVDEQGTFTGHVAQWSTGEESIYTYKVDPPQTRFESVMKETNDTHAGDVNFEILFEGKTGTALNFLYREFTSEDMAKAAFFQNLTCPVDSKTFRFKKIRIGIVDVTDEKITYTVLEDGG